MGASAREIEDEIKSTRERMEQNLSMLENRAKSRAARYAKVAAIGLSAATVAVAGFFIYRRMRRPRLNEPKQEPGTLANIMRSVAPALVGTVSTSLLRRFIRRSASQAD